MQTSKKDLWLRLKRYQFEHLVPQNFWGQVVEAFGGADASTKAFANKLSRKLGWSKGFASRAIGEYRKFVYLGMVSPFNVTPSKILDQVWHEHQLFTQGYRNFCAEVLGRHFDHNPELLPLADQTGVYQAQYIDTLELYRSEFNQEPPDDIWLIPKFQPAAVKKRASRSRRNDQADAVYGDAPLCTYFESSSGGQSSAFDAFDGGQSGGGGSGASWTEAESSADSGAGADGDAGSGDSGGSSDGGSSCSSSCGSSCGGGGGGD